MALSLALLAPLEVFVGYQALLPSNRGDVTAAEFYENMNEMSGYLGMDLWLDEEGRELADWSGTLSANGGPGGDIPLWRAHQRCAGVHGGDG